MDFIGINYYITSQGSTQIFTLKQILISIDIFKSFWDYNLLQSLFGMYKSIMAHLETSHHDLLLILCKAVLFRSVYDFINIYWIVYNSVASLKLCMKSIAFLAH